MEASPLGTQIRTFDPFQDEWCPDDIPTNEKLIIHEYPKYLEGIQW